MFQMTFAIITPALVIGGFAERMRFSAVLWFAALWLLLVYVPIAHWVWGGGWLAKLGVMDYAGGIVVHVSAGVAALVCALVLGPRRGFPQTAMAPHSLPLAVAGAGMLWVGWFGFNAGSALAANGNAGMAMLATHMGASAGALAWMIAEWTRYGKPSMLGAATGMVAGLGTITPASGFVGPHGRGGHRPRRGHGVFLRHAVPQAQARRSTTRWTCRRCTASAACSARCSPACSPPWRWAVRDSRCRRTSARRWACRRSESLPPRRGAPSCTWVILKCSWRWSGSCASSEEQETEGLDLAEHGERGYSP